MLSLALQLASGAAPLRAASEDAGSAPMQAQVMTKAMMASAAGS